MTTTPRRTEKNNYATHEDLNELRSELKSEFTGLKRELNESIRLLGNQLGDMGRTDWGTLISGGAILLVIVGLGASLIGYMITTEQIAREKADQIAKTQFDKFIANEYEPVEGRNIGLTKQVAVLEEQGKRFNGITDTIAMLLDRELDDAETRGRFDERFLTLKESLDGSIKNRKDIDAKHVASAASLNQKINEVDIRSEQRHQTSMAAIMSLKDDISHQIDNGLGRRIEEKTNGLSTDVEWLKQQIRK